MNIMMSPQANGQTLYKTLPLSDDSETAEIGFICFVSIYRWDDINQWVQIGTDIYYL